MDLSKYPFIPDFQTYPAKIDIDGYKRFVCIGWAGDVEYIDISDVVLPNEFIEKIALAYDFRDKFFAHVYRGVSSCGVCGQDICISINGRNTLLGHSELWIPFDNTIYISPDLLLHYILVHEYVPPREYVEAVLALDFSVNFYAARLSDF